MTFECRFYSVLVGQELVPGAEMNLSRLQRIVPCFTQHAFSLVSVTLLRSCLFVCPTRLHNGAILENIYRF